MQAVISIVVGSVKTHCSIRCDCEYYIRPCITSFPLIVINQWEGHHKPPIAPHKARQNVDYTIHSIV